MLIKELLPVGSIFAWEIIFNFINRRIDTEKDKIKFPSASMISSHNLKFMKKFSEDLNISREEKKLVETTFDVFINMR